MNLQIIRTDGRLEEHQIAAGPKLCARIGALIGADTLDVVNLRDGRVMLVDDNGYEPGPVIERGGGVIEIGVGAARKPVNTTATTLYWRVCVPGTTHEIVGDVAIARDEDFA